MQSPSNERQKSALNCKEALSSSVFLSSTGGYVFPVIIMSLLLIITLIEHSPCAVALCVTPPHLGKDVPVVFKATRVLAVLHWSQVWLCTWTFDTLRLTLPVSMNKPINRIFMFTGRAVRQKTGLNKRRRQLLLPPAEHDVSSSTSRRN